MDTMIIEGGTAADIEALYGWLHHEPELRSTIQSRQVASTTETMGAATEIVVALASSGTIGALARSVTAWLVERERQRRANLALRLTTTDGRTILLEAQRITNVESLLRDALSAQGLTISTVSEPDIEDG
jgi:hypothetical protein